MVTNIVAPKNVREALRGISGGEPLMILKRKGDNSRAKYSDVANITAQELAEGYSITFYGEEVSFYNEKAHIPFVPAKMGITMHWGVLTSGPCMDSDRIRSCSETSAIDALEEAVDMTDCYIPGRRLII